MPSVAVTDRATAVAAARLLVRLSRHSVRTRLAPARWWRTAVESSTGLRLEPVRVTAAHEWHEFVTAAGRRPPSVGITASPLGGAAANESSWQQACLDLRAAARRGGSYGYLVYLQGELAGEALAFVDGGTSCADLVIWLSPGHSAQNLAAAADLLAVHLFAGPSAPARAMICIPDEDREAASALTSAGFIREGVLLDLPRPALATFVVHRAADSTSTAV